MIAKFIKQNIVAVVGIAAIVISCLLLALPGQFFCNMKPTDYNSFSGYEFFFNMRKVEGIEFIPVVARKGKIIGAGLAILIMMAVAVVGYLFNKKSSVIALAAGLLSVVVAIMFLAMEATAVKAMGVKFVDGDKTIGMIKWVSYLNGSLMLVSGAFAIYKGILALKAELKSTSTSSYSGPSYNYLKK